MATDATPSPTESLSDIAQRILNLTTLATRNHDRLDFYDLHVSSIRAALEAAYAQGHADATAALANPTQN